VTTIPEKKREVTGIAGFLIVILGFAAFRGAERAPLFAGILATVALVAFAMWLSWWRKPPPMLAISPEEIFYGRLDQPGTRIARDPSGRLEFRRGFRNSGWVLKLADAPDQPGISMIGFDLPEVERACVAHGWTIG
jgi:hypothetical protein